MAQLALILSIETWPAREAAEAVHGVMAALVKRHGPQFRALERRIEGVMESGIWCGAAVALVGDPGAIIIPASPEVAAILAEARDLGVIS